MQLEYQYALQLRPYLEGFTVKKTNPLLINFRCPFCGDSQTHEQKRRGYIIQESNGKVYYYCHKCRVHGFLWEMLKHFSPTLYGDYRLALLRENRPELPPAEVEKRTHKRFDLENHHTIRNISAEMLRSDASPAHEACAYIIKRKIPMERWSRLYHCSDYAQLLIDVGYEKAVEFPRGKQRVVIPSYAPNGQLIAIDGRALDPAENPRYLKYTLDETYPTVYGLDRLDVGKRMWFFEGQFDSMFVENGAAIGGSHRTQLFDHYFDPYRDNVVFVTDNEPRNKFVVKEVKKTLQQGYAVVIWPNSFKSKDLNDMILSGEVAIDAVPQTLEANLYKGLTGLTRLAEWSK